MKYLNCPWCGSSHGFLNNNCPSCGGTLTHKSDLLSLILNKLHINNDDSKTKETTENKSDVKTSSSLTSIRKGIISIFLMTSLIMLAVAFFANNTSNNTSKSDKLISQESQKKLSALSAKQQLHQLIRDEKIKIGSKNDFENWTVIARKNNEPYKHRMYPGGNTYIVKEQITFPDDMYGSHSKIFILKGNVKLPYGDIAHNTVYFMSDGKCLGTGCMR